MGMESMLFAVEESVARISLAYLFVSGQLLGDHELVNKSEGGGREGAAGCGAALAVAAEGEGHRGLEVH